MTERRGFALITVLWILTVATVIAAAGALAGRNAVNATRNRTELRRAFWIAQDCASRVRAAIDDSLGAAIGTDRAADFWRGLERRAVPVRASERDGCIVTLEAAGSRLDVNAANDTMIVSVLHELGFASEAGALVDALEDWRDTDDVARPQGVEAAWYRAAHRELPRNGPLVSVRELGQVRGFEDVARFDSVFTIEPGRISLATAGVAVLLAVPGFTRETAERIVEHRDAGRPVRSPLDVLAAVSSASADTMMAHYPEIVRVATPDPDAWILTVAARSGNPRNEAVLEWRLVRVGKRCVITRSRSAI